MAPGQGTLRRRNTGEKEEEETEEGADIPESPSVWRGSVVQGCNTSQMRREGLTERESLQGRESSSLIRGEATPCAWLIFLH